MKLCSCGCEITINKGSRCKECHRVYMNTYNLKIRKQKVKILAKFRKRFSQ